MAQIRNYSTKHEHLFPVCMIESSILSIKLLERIYPSTHSNPGSLIVLKFLIISSASFRFSLATIIFSHTQRSASFSSFRSSLEHLRSIIQKMLIKDLRKPATLDLLHKFFFLQTAHLDLLFILRI